MVKAYPQNMEQKSNKGIAGGYCGLDADTKIPEANRRPNVTTGTYVGNGVQNRAIPHGLGRRPNLVIIVRVNTAGNIYLFHSSNTQMYTINATSFSMRNVTDMDDTNFYVGDNVDWDASANLDTLNYGWVAIG